MHSARRNLRRGLPRPFGTQFGRSSPEAAELLTRLQREPVRVVGLDGMRLREESDAVATSLQLAGITMQDEMFPQWAAPLEDGEAFGASIHPDFVMDLEDDLIAADLVRFRCAGFTSENCRESASVITERGIRLTVINVNRKSLEEVHGVDLVYYDHINDQATAVQYKRRQRIDVNGPGRIRSDWVCRRKPELEKQLELMRQQPRPGAPSSADWRRSSIRWTFDFPRYLACSTRPGSRLPESLEFPLWCARGRARSRRGMVDSRRPADAQWASRLARRLRGEAAYGDPCLYLPSRLWLLGLGHLGQAYAWAGSAVELMLQDFDARRLVSRPQEVAYRRRET